MFTKSKNKKILAVILAFALVLVLAPAIFAGTEESLGTSLGESGEVLPSITPFAAPNKGQSMTPRDIVLVLDVTGSMAGTPITELRKAAINFVNQTFEKAPFSKIGVVTFGHNDPGYAIELIGISGDKAAITQKISTISANGWTNYQAGIEKAKNLFEVDEAGVPGAIGARKGVKKAVIFMTDGQPNRGLAVNKTDGPFAASLWPGIDASNLPYANGAVQLGQDLLADTDIEPTVDLYTLGFFHNASGEALRYQNKIVEEMQKGQSEDRFFTVTDGNDLDFVFGEIMDDLTNESPVIIIPDMFGTTLYADSGLQNKVWPRNSAAGMDSDFAMSKTLYFSNYDSFPEDQHDTSEYGAGDTYESIITSFVDKFTDREIYFFGYDFRLSTLENAQLLEDFVVSLTDDKTVDLIGHGMGAIIAAQYVEKDMSAANDAIVNPSNEGLTNLDQANLVISLGAAFEGIPALANATLSHAIPAAGTLGHNNNSDVLYALSRNVKATFPSLAELFPSERYALEGNFTKRGPWNAATQTFDLIPLTAQEYENFLTNFFGATLYNDSIAIRENIADNLSGMGNQGYFAYATNLHTVDSLTFQNNPATGNTEIVDLTLWDGDTWVARKSAEAFGDIKLLDYKYVYRTLDYTNIDLIGVNSSNQGTVDWLKDILLINTSPPTPTGPSGEPLVVIRIACPVDVSISYAGETLSNNPAKGSRHTSFGELYVMGENGDIKLVSLNDPSIATSLTMTGTGTGTMEYSLRRVSYSDDLSEQVVDDTTFKSVEIRPDTVVTTSTKDTNNVLLMVKHGNEPVIVLDQKTANGAPTDPKPPVVTPDPDPDPPVITPPIVKPPVVKPVVPPTTPDRPSTSSGSSSGSGRADLSSGNPVSTPVVKTFNKTDAKNLFTAALAKKAANEKNLFLRAYNYNIADTAALKELAALANNAGVELTVYFDTVQKGLVVSRVKINPAKISTTINLNTVGLVDVNKTSPRGYSFAQITGFSKNTGIKTPVEVAIALDKALTKNLVFFTYNATTKTFTQLKDMQYRIDSAGFVHFTTDLNTAIAISSADLAK